MTCPQNSKEGYSLLRLHILLDVEFQFCHWPVGLYSPRLGAQTYILTLIHMNITLAKANVPLGWA